MYQYMAYSEQFVGTSEEQNNEQNSTSPNQAMEVDTTVAENGGINNDVHENSRQETKEDGEDPANGQDGVLPSEDHPNTENDAQVSTNDENTVA